MPNRTLYVLGCGGHAKVVASTLLEAGDAIAGFLDDNPNHWGKQLLGVSILGPLDLLKENPSQAIIAIGDNLVRKQVASQYPGTEWATVIHPRAYVHASSQLGPGTVVFAGAVVQPSCVIAAHVIVNTCASVDHDCLLGEFSHIAPGAHLAGNVQIGGGAFIGIGSSLIQGTKVGDWATIGAGATVIKDIPPNVVAMGTPATVLRVKDQQEIHRASR